MLKRISTLAIPPERLDRSGFSGTRSGGKKPLPTVSQMRVPLPPRIKPPGVHGQIEGAEPKGFMPGPSRQLYPVSPRSCSADISLLNGIAALPPTNSELKRVLRSTSKRVPKKESISSKVSRLPRFRTSIGSTSNKKFSSNRKVAEAGTVRKMIVAKREVRPDSPTLDSTAIFEADELAMRSSTPGVRMPSDSGCSPNTSSKCSCNLAKAVGDASKLCGALVKESKDALSAVLSEQQKLLSEQKKLLSEQTELIQQQKKFYSENTQLVKVQIEMMNELKSLFRSHSPSTLVEDEDVNMSSDEQEKENATKQGEVRSLRAAASANPPRALQQYNEIRAVFNSLSLRTPMTKTGHGPSVLTPKTPKSIMSRTLQHQLGEIFNDS